MPDATWQLYVTDASDMEIVDALNPPQVAKWTRRRNGYAEMYLEIVNPDDFAQLSAYDRGILLMRDGAPVYHGPIVEPFTRNPRLRKVTSKDPYFGLSWRRVRTDHRITDLSCEAARTLILAQDDYADTKIVLGDAVSSPMMSRKFAAGEAINEKIEMLGKIGDDPWDFHIDALGTGTPGKFGEIVFHGRGLIDNNVQFHFGQGTLENCDDYEVTDGQVVNRKTIIVQNGDTYTEENAGSIAAYGLWEDERGEVLADDSDSSDLHVPITEETLSATAEAGLHITVPQTITIQPNYYAPKLIEAFDVDCTVHLWIKDNGFEIRASCIPDEIVVSMDENGIGETIEAMDLTVVSIDG